MGSTCHSVGPSSLLSSFSPQVATAAVAAPPRLFRPRVRCSSARAQPRPAATPHCKAACCSASMLAQPLAWLLHAREADVLCFLAWSSSSASCLLRASATPLHPRSSRRRSSAQRSHRPQLLRARSSQPLLRACMTGKWVRPISMF